VNLSMNHSVSQ